MLGLYPPVCFQLLGEQGDIQGTNLREWAWVDPRRTGEPQYDLEAIRNVLKRISNMDYANRWQKLSYRFAGYKRKATNDDDSPEEDKMFEFPS